MNFDHNNRDNPNIKMYSTIDRFKIKGIVTHIKRFMEKHYHTETTKTFSFQQIHYVKEFKFESSKSKKYSNMHFNQEFSLFISSRKKGAVEKSLDTVSLTCRYCTVYCSVRKLPTTQCNHIPPLISGPIQ